MQRNVPFIISEIKIGLFDVSNVRDLDGVKRITSPPSMGMSVMCVF
jgi:hypothetical protein